MTIEQAIDDLMDASRSIAEVAESESDEANRINAQNVADDCKQLAEWLRELAERRKAPEIIRCCECDYWKSGMKYCTHPNGMNSDLDNGFCSMAERRTDGRKGI